jgi:hypothetical protein
MRLLIIGQNSRQIIQTWSLRLNKVLSKPQIKQSFQKIYDFQSGLNFLFLRQNQTVKRTITENHNLKNIGLPRYLKCSYFHVVVYT